jgi:hypothetical protein
VAAKRLQKDKFYVINVASAVVLRGIWLTRNAFLFKKQEWLDVKVALRRILRLMMEWEPIIKESKMEETKKLWCSLEQLIIEDRKPLKLITKQAMKLLEEGVAIRS